MVDMIVGRLCVCSTSLNLYLIFIFQLNLDNKSVLAQRILFEQKFIKFGTIIPVRGN